MIFLLTSISFALSMLDVTNGVVGRSSFQISGSQERLDLEMLQYQHRFEHRELKRSNYFLKYKMFNT